jgi:hypothetical protein
MYYTTRTISNQALAHCPSFGTTYTGFAIKDGLDDAVQILATTEVCFTLRMGLFSYYLQILESVVQY